MSNNYRLVLGKLLLAFFLLVILAPLVVVCSYALVKDTDFKQLCNAYRQNNLKCPFYVTAIPFVFIACLMVLYGLVILYYVFRPIHFPTYIISEMRNSRLENYKARTCRKYCIIVCKIVALLIILATWGCVLYFIFYFVARLIVISSRSRDIYEDIALAILPMLIVIKDTLLNVTDQYKVITGSVFNLVRKEETFQVFIQNKYKNIDPKRDPEKDRDKDHNKDPDIGTDKNTVIDYDKNSKPNQAKADFQENNSLIIPLAFFYSMLPSTMYAMLFFLFLNFGSYFSNSTEIAGYASFILTAINIGKSQSESYLRSLLIKDSNPGEIKWLIQFEFKSELEEILTNYEEYWIVSDVTFVGQTDKVDSERNTRAKSDQHVETNKQDVEEDIEAQQSQI